jgi:acylphosphatase
MSTAPVRWRAVFFGRVQGVGFRYFCQAAARERGVRGWVRNRTDGAVEMEAEADLAAVEDLMRHLQTRHPYARVERVETEPMAPRREDMEGFEIEP